MTLVPVTAVVGGVHGARAAGGVQIQVPDGRCVSSGCEPPCPPLKLVRCDLQTPDLVFTYTANQELVSNQTGECLSLWGPTGPGVGMYVRCKCVCECRARGMGRGRGWREAVRDGTLACARVRQSVLLVPCQCA